MKEINDYKIFENEDEAVYVAKSKEDVYDYFVDHYGSTEWCQNQSKDEFINGLTEIDIDSAPSKKIRTFISDDDGSECKSSYYEEYKKAALNNHGVSVIAFLTW